MTDTQNTDTPAAQRYADLTRDHQERAQLADAAPRPSADQLLDAATGTVAVGRLADGTTARVPLWNVNGAVHTHISARAGAGSSTLIDHLLAAEHASPLVRSWVADANGARPSHRLADRATTAKDGAADLLLEAVELLRERLLDTDTDAAYAPTPERPLISITLGDWPHLSTRGDVARMADEIARTGRLAGVSLRVETWGVVFQPPLPLIATALRDAHQIVLTARLTPGLGTLAHHPAAPAQLFRTWDPTEG
ncbi:hypothetical protein AB0K43_30930 [Kitasatospora sp. NPDC049258]|uniref:hypothetical protein n=1 Tax=Kitasatospora sp. NPDC049258 TaxID=3155394 RepID=UPI0034461DE9